MTDYGTCRSCRAQVRWAKSASTGKPMPLDRSPDRGNVLIDANGRAHVFKDHGAAVAAVMESDRYGTETFMSHHATCPEGPAWKGKKRKDPDAPSEPVQESLL